MLKRKAHRSALPRALPKLRLKRLSTAAAKALLHVRMDDLDQARLRSLALRNRDDVLTAEEKKELDAYLNAGMLLDWLQAHARRSLARR